MKRHAHIPKLLWYVLLSVLFVSLLLLSACDSHNPPSDTTAESVEQTTEAPTEETPDGTAPGTGDGDSFTLPDEDEPTAEPDTTAGSDPAETTEEPSSEGDDPEEPTEADTPGAVITLPEETVPEPETDARPMPRLDIYTDDGGDVTSKDHYKHGTATLSNCHEKFAFENVGVNIRARGNSTFHAPKKPFRLKFDAKQEMLGLNGGKAYKSWVLLADYYDGSMLRTYGTFKFAMALMEKAYYSSDCTHVEVYLNGEYRGVYLLCEQTQMNRGRVDIPEKEDGDTSLEHGYLMIGVGGQADEPELVTIPIDLHITDRTGQTRYYHSINFTLSGGSYTEEQKAYVSRYVAGVFQVMGRAIYENEYFTLHRDGRLTPKRSFEWAVTDEEKQIETISAVFNLESAVSMCILDEICKNLDAMAFNMYVDLSPEGDGVLTLAAPWDFDFSMANTHYSTTHSYTGFYATNFSESEGVRVNFLYVLLGRIPWFEDMIREHWQENYTELKTVVSDMVSVNHGYDAAFNRDWDRWGKAVNRNLIHHHSHADLATFNEHADAGTFVTDWLTMRLWWLNKQWGDGSDATLPGAEEAPELQLTFKTPEDMAIVTDARRCTVELTEENGLLLRPDYECYDPYFSFNYDLIGKKFDAMFYPILEFTYKVPRGNSQRTYTTELFLCTGGIENATGGVSTTVEIEADGKWHTVRIDLSETGFWAGTIHEIRMDFFSSCEPDDKMYLRDFKLLTQ